MPKILNRVKVKAPLIKGTPLYYPDAVGLKYWAKLAPIFNAMTRETEAEVKALFESPAAHWAGLPTQDASISELSKALINRLLNKYLRIFDRDLGDIVLRMMTGVDKASTASLSGSLSKMGESLTISPDYFVKSMGETFKALTTKNVAMFKTIAEQHFAKVETAVMDSIISGNGLKDLNPFFETHSTGEKNYAKTRSMDQTRKAYQSVNLARMRKLGIKKFEWLHSGGSNEPRKLHIELSGKIFEIDKPPFIGIMYGERIYGYPGQLPNCFTGSTKVSLDNGCRNVWRYWYEGDIVNLVVGDEVIECTPNHPILTGRGWLSANEIEEGDYLISSNTNNIGRIDVEVHENMTTFENLFISGVLANGAVVSRGREFNFHGDIPEEDVHSVIVNDKLPLWTESVDCEQIEKLVFALTDSISGDSSLSIDAKVFHASATRLFCDGDTLIGSELSHSCEIGFVPISQGDSVVVKDCANSFSEAIERDGERENAFTCEVARNYITGLGKDGVGFCSDRAEIVNPSSEGASQMPRANAIITTKGFNGDSAIKLGLCVKKKSISIFRGHVYTLESFNGWYSVTPAQIISKNCRCMIRPVIEFDDDDE